MKAAPSALVAVLLAALAGPPPAAADPAGVRVGREPGRTRVVLDLDAPPSYRHFLLSAPDRAVFDIEGVVLAEPPSPAEFIGSPVAQLRAAPRDERGDASACQRETSARRVSQTTDWRARRRRWHARRSTQWQRTRCAT